MKMFKNSFWGILKKGDWNNENTDEVFEPIINFLVNHKDQYIFDFHELMSEFLYELELMFLQMVINIIMISFPSLNH